MSCDDCTQATQRMHHGFSANCLGCAARALVRSPHWRTAFGPSGFGWNDLKLLRLCEFYKVNREQVEHAAKVDAKHNEATAKSC